MKHALVTGVTKGIGKNIALTLNKEGYHIFGVYKWSENYKDEENLADDVSKEISDLSLIPCDLKNRESYDLIANIIGDKILDAVVHNAGEFMENSWENFNIEAWDRSIGVNMEAPILLTKRIEKNIKNNSSIVIISSTDGWYAGYGDLGYSVSKSGLNNVTKSLAAALADRQIRVNAILPGWVNTQMGDQADINEYSYEKCPLKRNADTHEISNVVSFLLSDKSSFINGSLITVDGGYSSIDYVIKKEYEKSKQKNGNN